MADTKRFKGFSLPVTSEIDKAQFSDLKSLLKQIVESIAKSDKELKFQFNNIDSSNVTRLNTNITSISSEDGETLIDGPLLQMYDATPTLRLEMGYDTTTSAFIFSIKDATGVETFGISSGGDAVIEGTAATTIKDSAANSVQQNTAYNTVKITTTDGIVATRSDSKARTSIAGGEILIEKGDGVGAWEDTFYVDSNGDAIFSGKVIIGDTYPVEILDSSGSGIVRFYAGTTLKGWMAYLAGTDALTLFTPSPTASAIHIISLADIKLESTDEMNFNPTGALQINGTAGWTGTFTEHTGKTVTVTKGIITNVA